MKRVLIVLFGILIFGSGLLAQKKFVTPSQASSLEYVKKLTLPTQDNIRLKKKELSLRKSGRADHFAVPLDVDIDIHQDGTWEYLDNDQAVWRKQIVSKNAKSLNLGFTSYEMPGSTEMFIYTPDHEISYGPFSKSDNEDHAQFWSPILKSDHIVIEVQTHIEMIDKIELVLSYVNHDFMDFSKSGAGSGSCNLDVACGSEDGWPLNDRYRDIINSVGAYTLNGIAQCSGALINNSKNDCTPYFLTANHCEVTNDNASSVVVYWNFQNKTCRQPGGISSGDNGNGTLDVFNTGAILRASLDQTDMALLELDDPVESSTSPYFAGWNLQETLGDSSICVHHPGVEEKRISFDFDNLIFNEGGTDFLRVENWEIGTTEGGSSGSPLFDKSGMIVGQLFGGQAACGNQLWDRYGWIRTSWEGNGTPPTRLKDWLDPLGIGMESLSGKSCEYLATIENPSLNYCATLVNDHSFDLEVSSNFSGPVSITVDGLPNGITISFSANPVDPGMTTTVTLIGLETLATEKYLLNWMANDGDGNSATTSFLLDTNTGIPEPADLIFPDPTSMNLSTRINFSWESTANSYDIEIANDVDFDNIVYNSTGLTRSSLIVDLDPDNTYYWRIKPYNVCGAGDFGPPLSFTIEKIDCSRVFSNHTPIEIISAGPNVITSTINFDKSATITDINVRNIMGRHSWIDDLTFSIISPDGTEVRLMTQVCGDQNDFNLGFDDESDLLLSDLICPPVDGMFYMPQESLTIFNGKNAQGEWQLKIDDGFLDDGGELISWELEICADFTNDYSISIADEVLICDNENTEVGFALGLGFGESPSFMGQDVNNVLAYDFQPLPDGHSNEYVVLVSNLDQVSGDDYSFQIMVTEGDEISEIGVNLVFRNSPDIPMLNVPVNLDTDVAVGIEFVWDPVENAQNYLFELSLTEDFAQSVFSTITDQTRFMMPQDLEVETNYFWRITAQNDCGSTSSNIYSFVSEESSGTFDLGDGKAVSIYPVPTSDFLNIDLTQVSTTTDIQARLVSIDGRVAMTFYDWSTSKNNVDLSTLSSGLYLLEISLGNEIIIDKVIKE